MYPAQMRSNILLGIFVGICIVHVHCISDSENEENVNAAPNKALVKSACEKSKLQVVCPKGQVINVIQAIYGRVNNLAKCNPKKTKKFNTKCRSSIKSLTIMRQRCQMKQSCSVDATNSVFGDPCPKTIKYLEIKYRCVAERVTTKKITNIKKTTPRATTPKKRVTTKKITNIKKTTPRATTPKKVATPKIPPKKVTPQPVTTSKSKGTTIILTTEKPTPKVGTETTTKFITEKPTPKVSTETTAKLTTEEPTPKVSTETTAKLITEKTTPKVSTETTTKLTTEKLTPKVGMETTTKLITEKPTPKVSTETTAKLITEKTTPKVSTFEDTTLREITTVENKPQSKYACEHDTLHIECEVGKVIRVLGANYGRTSMEVCSHNSAKHWDINCLYRKTEEIMRKMCDGKKNCNVVAENSVFADNCAYTLKYLEVNYLCEDEITTKPPSTTNLDIESSVTTTEIPKATQELPSSTTLKPLTEVLVTTSTESPVTTSEMPVTTKRLIVTPSDDETTTETPTTATSPTPKATSTHESTPPVPSTTKEIPILPTSKPRVTAPETRCDEEDLDCIIDDLGKRPDWFICEKDMGSYPHPASKKLFIFCLNWKPSVKKCGQGRVFSEKLMTCINP